MNYMDIKRRVEGLLSENPDGLSARVIVAHVLRLLPKTAKKNVYQSLAYELRKGEPRWFRPRKGFYQIRERP